MRNLIPTLVLAAVLGAAAGAQPLGTDLLVGDHLGNVMRVNASTGAISTIGNYAPVGRVLWDLTLDANDRNVIASLAPTRLATGELVSIDIATGVATTVATGVSSVLTQLDEDGDYVLGTLRNVYEVDRSTQAITTLYTALSAALADRDVSTGNWLIADLNQLAVYDPSSASVVSTLAIGASGHMAFAVDPNSYDAYTSNFAIHRIDIRNGMTTQTAAFLGLGSVGDQALAIDRAPTAGGGLVYAYGNVGSTNQILVVDRNGNTVRTYGPFGGQPTGITFDRGRNLSSVRTLAPNDRSLVVSFANAGGQLYTVLLSLAGSHPGFLLPDGRRVGLNLDALSGLTFGGPLPPLFNNNIGRLDASGRAVATLNLNPLGNALQGTRIWAIAAALDPNAPSGVAQVGSPIVIVL